MKNDTLGAAEVSVQSTQDSRAQTTRERYSVQTGEMPSACQPGDVQVWLETPQGFVSRAAILCSIYRPSLSESNDYYQAEAAELVRRANAYDALVQFVHDVGDYYTIFDIRGHNCPACGRDNSDDGDICTADDCMGVRYAALLASLQPSLSDGEEK